MIKDPMIGVQCNFSRWKETSRKFLKERLCKATVKFGPTEGFSDHCQQIELALIHSKGCMKGTFYGRRCYYWHGKVFYRGVQVGAAGDIGRTATKLDILRCVDINKLNKVFHQKHEKN